MNPFSIDVKDYTVTAGVPLRIYMPASFFQLMEATGPVDVEFLRSDSTFGRAADVPLGFSVGPLRNDETFDAVEILSATTQTVKLCFARGSVDLRALTQVTGTVQVVNGELTRVLAGQAFSGVADIAAAAGVYSHVQLWNPAASGKNLVISRMNAFSATGATSIRVGKSSAALATLVGSGSGVNKMLSGAASSAELRSNNNAAILVAPADRLQTVGVAAIYQTVDIPLGEPVVVVPGSGVIVGSTLLNTAMNASFQWSEVAI